MFDRECEKLRSHISKGIFANALVYPLLHLFKSNYEILFCQKLVNSSFGCRAVLAERLPNPYRNWNNVLFSGAGNRQCESAVPVIFKSL